ncbi:hypothetical protein GCM10022268_36760 [Sphingomonas cynarae]|uniref:Uncharacterized protein n=1 Tax=Sphingomonas cynarae TaxID=930197 RepID=A0ABP7EXD1_9SPHN
MPSEYTHSECFSFFGTVPKNTRWSWSGRSEDGCDVSVTLWQDRFEDKGRIYRSWQSDRPGEWKSRPGFVELIENPAHAQNVNAGIVHVILAQPRDKAAVPRSIARCFPHPTLRMRVVELDEQEGTRSCSNDMNKRLVTDGERHRAFYRLAANLLISLAKIRMFFTALNSVKHKRL